MTGALPGPLFRDPIHDGATDPVLVQHHDGTWWLLYTQRRAAVPGQGVGWVHGTDIGVAVSDDGGASFTYRGTLDLATGWGRDTYWAPEVLFAEGRYHLYVSRIRGVPVQWSGHERRIVHHVSDDLVHWREVGPLTLSSDRVIDACVAELPHPRDGGARWRMWFKDEVHGSHTWAADSPDLDHWDVVGAVIEGRPHEGPNVFSLGGWHWMLTDEWRGLAVHRSPDLTTWERDGLILDHPGARTDDGGVGLHADVVVTDAGAHVVYFTHPGRTETWRTGPDGPAMEAGPMESHAERRSSILSAPLTVVDGHLVCDRDHPERLTLPTDPPRRTRGTTPRRSTS